MEKASDRTARVAVVTVAEVEARLRTSYESPWERLNAVAALCNQAKARYEGRP
jgi:hypothetical protein